MAGGSYKHQKFQDLILNELNKVFRQELSDGRLSSVSITKVELSSDYGVANVYWDTYDSSKRGDAKKAITSVAGKCRKFLSQNIDSRTVPSLVFHYDSQYEDELKIDKLLKASLNSSEE